MYRIEIVHEDIAIAKALEAQHESELTGGLSNKHLRPGQVVTCKEISFNNQCGGTEISTWHKGLRNILVRVEIVKAWTDYETGERAIGRLVHAPDVAAVKRAARSKYATAAQKAAHDPSKVYVSEFDLYARARKGV